MDSSSVNTIVCNAGRGIRPDGCCMICICDSKFFVIVAETLVNRVNLVARKRQGSNPGCIAGSWRSSEVKFEKASPSTWRTGPRNVSQFSNSNFRLRKRVGGSRSVVWEPERSDEPHHTKRFDLRALMKKGQSSGRRLWA